MALPLRSRDIDQALANTVNFSDQEILALVEADMKVIQSRNDDYFKYRDYFEGENELVFATEEFKAAFGSAFKSFRSNWSEVVVETLEERLNLLNISGPEAETVWTEINNNNRSYVEGELYNGALVETRSTLFVWPETDGETITGVRLDPVKADKVYVAFENGDPRRPIRATKVWQTNSGRIHATLYTKTNIYKFESSYSVEEINKVALQGRRIPETMTRIWSRREVEGESWPLPNPYGEIPIVEFPNKNYKSEVKSVIPIQDGLNKALINMFVTMEYDAFRQKYMVTSNDPPDGGWKNTPGHVWQIEPETNFDGNPLPVQIGSFAPSDLAPYVNIIEIMLGMVASQSRTPGHYFMTSTQKGGRGDAPSGDALRVAETGLVKKIQNLHEVWDWSWHQVFRLILKTLNDFQDPDMQTLSQIKLHWQHPMAHYRFMLLEEGRKMINELNLPPELAWRHAGFSEADIQLALSYLDTQTTEEDSQEDVTDSVD